MYADAVLARLDTFVHPKRVCRVIVYQDTLRCTDKELTCYVIGYVLRLIEKENVTGWAVYLCG